MSGMKKRYPHKENILLVNITRLGDMLQATPTIAGMKMENPNAKVTVLVEKQFSDICNILPNIDEVVALDLGMTVRSLAREGEGIIDAYEHVTESIEDLKKRKFDYCLNMSSSAYTAILLNVLGIPKSGGWSSDDEGYRVIESEWARLFATSVFHSNRRYNSLNLVDVFRCSADVDLHPNKLMMKVDNESIEYCNKMIAEFGFTNTGPIIAVQAGASQGKRQWLPHKFIEFINILVNKHNARVILTGTKKELEIVDPIKQGCNSPNVAVAAGRTTLPQLAALLKLSKLLVTGDTGPMHMSVAVGTPVIAMFLASAFGFETGPYSEGNIVLQPVISCGPCNPNKGCAKPDCHETITPAALAEITALRLNEDIRKLPEGLVDPRHLTVYRTYFDSFGFYDMQPLNSEPDPKMVQFRNAYRKLWLDELAGFAENNAIRQKALKVHDPIDGALAQIANMAEQGTAMIKELTQLIGDPKAPGSELRRVNDAIQQLDIEVERIGFHYPELGPVTRMFVFAKENISGSDALGLASQMKAIYTDLGRRSKKLTHYYQMVN